MSITEGARSLVARTCAAQGVPESVTDPAILVKVAAILAGSRNGNAGPHHEAGVTNITT